VAVPELADALVDGEHEVGAALPLDLLDGQLEAVVLDEERAAGADVVEEDVAGGGAHGQVEAVAELERRDGAGLELRLGQQRVHVAVEHAHVPGGRARVPALHHAVRVAAREQLVHRVELAAVVLVAGGGGQRGVEAALLHVEAHDLVAETETC